MILSVLLSLTLWFTVLNALTSVLVGSGAGAVIIVASTASDVFETVLDAIATLVLGLLAAMGAILGAMFSLFAE